ncbi:MAG: hypothetical protein IKJ08_09110, partial [Alistipes sp.]|nr:hypothetical protein [Alistipes sp.]
SASESIHAFPTFSTLPLEEKALSVHHIRHPERSVAESKDLAIKDEETKETHNLERSHGEPG